MAFCQSVPIGQTRLPWFVLADAKSLRFEMPIGQTVEGHFGSLLADAKIT